MPTRQQSKPLCSVFGMWRYFPPPTCQQLSTVSQFLDAKKTTIPEAQHGLIVILCLRANCPPDIFINSGPTNSTSPSSVYSIRYRQLHTQYSLTRLHLGQLSPDTFAQQQSVCVITAGFCGATIQWPQEDNVDACPTAAVHVWRFGNRSDGLVSESARVYCSSNSSAFQSLWLENFERRNSSSNSTRSRSQHQLTNSVGASGGMSEWAIRHSSHSRNIIITIPLLTWNLVINSVLLSISWTTGGAVAAAHQPRLEWHYSTWDD